MLRGGRTGLVYLARTCAPPFMRCTRKNIKQLPQLRGAAEQFVGGKGGRAVASLANKTTTGNAIDVMKSLAYINPPTGLTATVE